MAHQFIRISEPNKKKLCWAKTKKNITAFVGKKMKKMIIKKSNNVRINKAANSSRNTEFFFKKKDEKQNKSLDRWTSNDENQKNRFEKLRNIGYFFKIQPKTTTTGILLSTMMMMMINTRHPYITCIKFTYIRFI